MVNNMNKLEGKNDTKKIKKYLEKMGYVCTSSPSAQNIVYSKNKEVVIIKNSKN